jgi:hypothetical protein
MRTRLLALAVLLSAVPVLAHHGGTSLYDVKKQVTADTTVTSFEWTNPHVEIGLDIKGDKGQVKHLVLETSSPPVMVNKGWNRKSLQTRDVIKVTYNPSPSGQRIGRLVKLVKADGQELRNSGS